MPTAPRRARDLLAKLQLISLNVSGVVFAPPIVVSSKKVRSFALSLLVATSAWTATGCTVSEEYTQLHGTIGVDGYALFAVENDRQQRNLVTVTVSNADPEATYVLFYSPVAPRNVGWFLFDPSSVSRCGGTLGSHCNVDGFGYMVDVVDVPNGATEVTLRDDQCGCDGNRPDRDWTGHWAVMRVGRTHRTNAVTIEVVSHKVKDFASEPKIRQLQ